MNNLDTALREHFSHREVLPEHVREAVLNRLNSSATMEVSCYNEHIRNDNPLPILVILALGVMLTVPKIPPFF